MAVDRDKVLQAAQKLVEKKRYDKAIVEYQRLVAEDPKDARTLLKIGDLHLKLEQYAEAIATYERVGQFYSAQGFAVKAIAVYKQIREIIHKHVPHLEDRFGHIVPRLAEVYTQLGLTSDALSAYDEVATRLQRAGRDRDAIDIFRKVVDLDPTNPLPYLRLAEAFVRVRDLDNAVQRFGAAADILLKLGRQDDAIKVLERLMQHRPDTAFARRTAIVYLDRGQPNDAMSALTKLQICFKENPKDLDTLEVLARAFDQLAQPSKAVEVLKEAARVSIEIGRPDRFQVLLDAIRTRAPDDPAIAQLMHQAQTGRSVAPPAQTPRPPPAEEEVDIDDILEEPESEAPFALRPSQHPGPARHASHERQAYRPPPLEATDPAARARAALGQAEQLRRQRHYDRAADVLRAILHELPGAREVREKLCDLLMEAGDQDGAIREMLVFAQHLASMSDIEGAARLLDEILLLDAGRAEALQMLTALGYTVPSSPAAPSERAPGFGPPQASVMPVGSYDPDAPLPSYDLEEVGAAQALSRRNPLGSAPPSVGQLDDPFAEAPLPSFAIDEPEAYVPGPASMRSAPLPVADVPIADVPISEAAYADDAIPPPPMSQPSASRRMSGEVLDEDALDEVEFFASHGMFDEARGLLDEQLSRLPGHPLLLEKLRELEYIQSGATADAGSGTRPTTEAAIDRSFDVDRSFDIAASLDALDALDALEPGAPGTQPAPEHESQISVESVFEQFKAGVAAQISQSDAATHYDLGVAYNEMGLYADAINEFELASRDPERECVCQSMMGMLHMHLGNVDAAIDSFIRGLHASYRSTEQELALTYEIASAYEQRSNAEQALYYFQRVARIDPNYSDTRGAIRVRIERLAPPPKAPARAVGAELVLDDFDAAFDDLLDGHGKLP